MSISLAATIFILVGVVVSAQAELVLKPLSANEIKSHLYGHTVSGEYSNGQRWAERFNSDGTSRYSQSGQVSSGTMTLNGDTWCFTYQNSSVGGCFEVWKHGPNCFSFYGSGSFATLDQRQAGKGWDARGWYVGQPPTCAGDQIS